MLRIPEVRWFFGALLFMALVSMTFLPLAHDLGLWEKSPVGSKFVEKVGPFTITATISEMHGSCLVFNRATVVYPAKWDESAKVEVVPHGGKEGATLRYVMRVTSEHASFSQDFDFANYFHKDAGDRFIHPDSRSLKVAWASE